MIGMEQIVRSVVGQHKPMMESTRDRLVVRCSCGEFEWDSDSPTDLCREDEWTVHIATSAVGVALAQNRNLSEGGSAAPGQ